ncbi:hypothetical protein G6F24_016000 [Rhizopus arrhizus]|nr:hypothetical protein G6F24_016000 [Rhizopus arrhizus]
MAGLRKRRPLDPVPVRAHHPARLRPPRVGQDQHQRREPQGQRSRRPGIVGRRADGVGRGRQSPRRQVKHQGDPHG